MNIDAEAVGALMNKVHRNAMKTLDRHNTSPVVAALVMDAYRAFLEEDFQKQMTDKYKIEYPLNFRVKDKNVI